MKFRLTGKFGELDPIRGMRSHSGIDIGTPENTVLRSVHDGVVERVFDGSGLIGKGVAIRMPDGTRSIYGHMNEVKMHVGENIKEGQIIGLSGNTGNSSGPHLHFGLQKPDGSFKDPTYLAEKVSNYAGNDFNQSVMPHIPSPWETPGLIPQLFGMSGEAVKEHAKDITIEILKGVGEAVGELLSSVALVGSGVCIILKVCGWKDGGRWAGILIGANVLLKWMGVKI